MARGAGAPARKEAFPAGLPRAAAPPGRAPRGAPRSEAGHFSDPPQVLWIYPKMCFNDIFAVLEL